MDAAAAVRERELRWSTALADEGQQEAAPGTLPAADYAAIIAYMLSYDCVKPSGNGKTPFPTGDISALKPITFGAKVCPPGGGKE
jgi:hypothetical protein